MFRFTNVSKRWADKARLVVDILTAHKAIVDFVGDRECPITINSTTNPASVTASRRSVEIEIADWYFEAYSIGYIMGMLCHEFGVHPMGDDEGIVDFENGLLNEPLETGIDGYTVVAARAGQRDHIFAGVVGMPRNRIYREVVLDMAAILAPLDMKDFLGGGSSSRVADLIDCYLMDIASILGTNDHRQKGPGQASRIADLYNVHRETVLQAARGSKRWDGVAKHIKTEPKTTFQVFSAYSGVAGSLIAGKVHTTCIVTAREKQDEMRRLDALVMPVIGNRAVWDSIGDDKL